MEPQLILIVEDETRLVELIRSYLEGEGYRVAATPSGRDGLELARSLSPDLVILDLNLPDLSGDVVCRELRKESRVPILMLTARSTEEDRVEGLKLGADDYVVKPFSLKELVARVRAILRRSAGEGGTPADLLYLQGGRLVIDLAARTAVKDGAPLSLTPGEFRLMAYLARHPGQALSRSQLIQAVWGYDFEGQERTVDAFVKSLRQKVEDQPHNPTLIVTVFGMGYRLDTSSKKA